tara:strand:+ start:5170 stop:6498 length:1329 start_codon:yes stop_codon:yes gene_type:complete
MGTSIKYFEKILLAIYLIILGLLVGFDRSAAGLEVFNFRVGEILIFGFLVICFILFFQIQNINYFSFLKEFILPIRIVNLLIIFFLVSLVVFRSEFFNPYVYRTSSYIWTIGAFFVSLYLFKDIKEYKKLSRLATALLLFMPFIHYLFSTGFYPNFIIDIFIQYSDKFTFPKASDVMLSLVVVNLLNIKIFKNKKFSLFYLITSVSIMLPLLLLMSRGSFLSVLVFTILFLFFERKFIIKNLIYSLIIFVFGYIAFTLSTYNVNDIDFNQDITVQELSITENIKEIAKKKQTRKAFLSFYFQDGRIMSVDNTTNWRLDIWQDVVEDLNSKNQFLLGYGYNEIIPVMLDPSAPGRLGRDGLNENVHNYLINVLARGGIFVALLIIYFHYSYIKIWNKKNGNYEIILLFIPAIINSLLDITMEGVQFPIIYYSFAAILFNIENK